LTANKAAVMIRTNVLSCWHATDPGCVSVHTNIAV